MTSEDACVAAADAQQVTAVLLLRVSHPMCRQGRQREETLATHFADEVSVTGMEVLVIGQTLSALKCLRAKRADECLFQGATPVPLERQQAGELVLTKWAGVGEGFLAVPLHVSVQGVLVSELRPAVGAFVQLLSSVTSGVCDKPRQSSKTLAALRAKVRFGVRQVVSVHQTLQSKGLVTRRTGE